MKIYIAAKYERRHELKAVDATLRAAGHETTSQWLHGAEEGKTKAQNARMDVDDVGHADCVLFFSQPEGAATGGGGRHFEVGLACAWGKRIIVVGEREIIFHHLPEVVVVPTVHAALEYLDEVGAEYRTPNGHVTIDYSQKRVVGDKEYVPVSFQIYGHLHIDYADALGDDITLALESDK